MCGKTRRERIRNKILREMIGAIQIEDKLRRNRLRWFDHVQRRPVDAIVKKSDKIAESTLEEYILAHVRERTKFNVFFVLAKSYIHLLRLSHVDIAFS